MPRVRPARDKDADGKETAAGGVQAVLLALEVLETLARRGSAGVTEIAQAVSAPKARVHRHLRTLVQAGYASQQAEGERYGAGARLLALARVASGEKALVAIASPVMERLRNALGHSVNLSRVTPEEVNIIASYTGTSVLGIVVKPYASLPLHASAGGKVALAFAGPEERPALDPSKLEALTVHTLAEPQALDREVARIRQQGWAGAPEEMVLGINAVAAPIWGHDQKLVGALSLLNSIHYLGRRPPKDHIQALLAAAEEISEVLSLRRSAG